MKLRIRETNEEDFIIYVDMVPYSYKSELSEDKIDPEFTFEKGHVYNSDIDTRWCILTNYIVPISNKIKSYSFVKKTDPYASSVKNEDGLSNYLGIEFIHPDGVPESALDEFYRFKLRFSEHEDKHPENGPVEPVHMIGMKAKNLQKAAMRIFKTKVADIQNNIRKFEIDYFGEQKTFFNMDELKM